MVIVDSTVWIDFLNGQDTPQTNWLDRELESQLIGLTDLNLCEIMQGFKAGREAAMVEQELLEFDVLVTGGETLALEAARNYRRLRSKGKTIRTTIDCLIATYCLINDHTLLHDDRDFDAFEDHLGLKVIHP
jgi:predicted nucleic acid-binding protein